MKQCFLSKQFVAVYSESPSDFLVLLNEYIHVYTYMYLVETDAASVSSFVFWPQGWLCSFISPVRIYVGCWEPKPISFKCDTADTGQEEKAPQLSMVVPVVTYRLHGCWRILAGAEGIHRLCLGCAQDILLLLRSSSSGAACTLLCYLLILHSNSTFTMRFDSNKVGV